MLIGNDDDGDKEDDGDIMSSYAPMGRLVELKIELTSSSHLSKKV